MTVTRHSTDINGFPQTYPVTYEAIDHRRYSKLFDRVKKSVAALETLEEHDVKADHTIVVLAVQVAERQGSTKLLRSTRPSTNSLRQYCVKVA